jgi:hypothetical protein
MTKEEKRTGADAILWSLATNGPSSKWQLAKELHLHYGNTWKAVNQMLSEKLIKVVETRPARARASGTNKKIEVEYYDLTLLGFLGALRVVKVKPENKALIVSVIKKQSHLHLLFAKWNTLRQQIPESELFPALSRAVSSICYQWRFHPSDRQVNEDLPNYFTEQMLLMVLTAEKRDKPFWSIDKWLEAIHQDKELKRYVETRIKESIRKDRETLEYREELLRKLG